MTKERSKTSEEHMPFIRNDLFVVPHDGSGEPFLLGSKCTRCGRAFFPRKTVCPDCLIEGTMQDLPLSTRGKLYTGTIAHTAPLGFKPPYVVGYTDLPEGVRVFSEIKDFQICQDYLVPGTEMLAPGTEMELVIEKIREDDEGNDVIGYKFMPVKKAK